MSKLDISYNNYQLNLKDNDDTKNFKNKLKKKVNLSSNSSISLEFDLNIQEFLENFKEDYNFMDEANLINDYYYCINNKADNLRYKNNIRNLFKI